MTLRFGLIASILFLSINYSFAQEINSPADIIKILEKSEIGYEIGQLSEAVEPPDYSQNINVAEYYTTENGFEEIELDEATFELKEKTEALFADKKYEAARENYLEIYKKYPKYSKISTYIGQTYELQGDSKTATEWYKKSIDNNYIDYLAHWFLGRSYFKAGKVEKGTEQVMIAHILNRNSTIILKDLIAILESQDIEYDNWVFNPQVEVKSKGKNEVSIYFGGDWLSYGLTKAVWAYEPGYKKSKGVEEDQASTLEDKEALLGLYIMTEDKKKAKKIKSINALHIAGDNKMFDEYILYESFLPRLPMVAYQLSEEEILGLVEYVKTVRCVPMSKKKKKKRKK